MSIGHMWGHTDPVHARYIHLAAQARAQTLRDALAAVGAPLVRSARWVGDGIGRAQRRRATARVLDGLSDDILRDIGLTRADISEVALTISTGRIDPEAGLWVRRLGPMAQPAAVAVPPLPPVRRTRAQARPRPPVAAPAARSAPPLRPAAEI